MTQHAERWYSVAINEIEKTRKRLKVGEKAFVASVKKQVEAGRKLTKQQEADLMEIYSKATEIIQSPRK